MRFISTVVLLISSLLISACSMSEEQRRKLTCLDQSGMFDQVCNPSRDYDWDWDYQPGNGQFVCRGIQTGRYAVLENCRYDRQDDDRWPG